MTRQISVTTALLLLASSIALADTPPTYLGRWGGSGSDLAQFNAPRGVAVDPYGDVYIADYNNQRIQKFDALGAYIRNWGSFGSGDGQFIGPFGVATSNAGNLYVAEISQARVQEFTRDGTFIRKWGASGTGTGQFQGPIGIAISSKGAVYVIERSGYRIQEFDLNGGFIRTWGSNGAGDGQFLGPQDVAVGLDGSVYATDLANGVQKFDSTGTFITKFDWTAIGTPGGIAVDPQGNLLVTDSQNKRVVVEDPVTGAVLTTFGSSGTGPGQFLAPEKIGVSPSGYIYVSDSQLNLISLFIPAGVSAPPSVPGGFALFGSIPNPAREGGEIRYELPAAAPVTAGIYDVSGRLVRQVCENLVQSAGPHELPWDGRGMAAGIYQVVVQSGSFSSSKKIVVLE